MRQIAFGSSLPALLAHSMELTRRDWTPAYASLFKAGALVEAIQYRNGPVVGLLRLSADPYQQHTADIPETDFDAEGFRFLAAIGARIDGRPPREAWEARRANPRLLFVVRFKVEKINAGVGRSRHYDDGTQPRLPFGFRPRKGYR